MKCHSCFNKIILYNLSWILQKKLQNMFAIAKVISSHSAIYFAKIFSPHCAKALCCCSIALAIAQLWFALCAWATRQLAGHTKQLTYEQQSPYTCQIQLGSISHLKGPTKKILTVLRDICYQYYMWRKILDFKSSVGRKLKTKINEKYFAG